MRCDVVAVFGAGTGAGAALVGIVKSSDISMANDGGIGVLVWCGVVSGAR